MSKLPSAETQLRRCKSDLHQTRAELRAAQQSASDYRARASQAEAEVAEWKRRFDALLKIVPPNEQ